MGECYKGYVGVGSGVFAKRQEGLLSDLNTELDIVGHKEGEGVTNKDIRNVVGMQQ